MMDDIQQFIQLIGGQIDLLMIIQVIPFLDLPKKMLLQFLLDDRCNLKQKI